MLHGVWGLCYALFLAGSVVWPLWRGGSCGSRRRERLAFWGLSLPLLGFTAWRPYGIAHDDYAYWRMFDSLCPLADCGQWRQSDRDFVWYTLLAGLKSFWLDTRLVLMVSALCLLLKLAVLDRLCRRPLLGLLAYATLFYPIYDLTALRVSMAVSIYLLGFWLLVRCCALAGLPYLLVNGLVHKQAFSAPAVLIGWLLGWRWFLLPLLLLLALALLSAGLYPTQELLQGLDLGLNPLGLDASALARDLATYFNQKRLGTYDHVRLVPLTLLPVLLLLAWLAPDLWADDRRLYAYSAGSIVVAVACLWALADLPEVQMRFVHFFLVPVVFFVGNARLEWRKILPAVLVCLIFAIRYGILHPILTLPCTLDWVKLDPVTKQRICAVPVK